MLHAASSILRYNLFDKQMHRRLSWILCRARSNCILDYASCRVSQAILLLVSSVNHFSQQISCWVMGLLRGLSSSTLQCGCRVCLNSCICVGCHISFFLVCMVNYWYCSMRHCQTSHDYALVVEVPRGADNVSFFSTVEALVLMGS